MKEIKLLIVEDNELDIQSYKDNIRNLNEDLNGEYIISSVFKTTKDEGLRALKELKDELDGAFIDLKLQSGATVDTNEGNEIIGNIYQKLRFPIIVLTNTPGGFNQQFKQSLFLKVYTKTEISYIELLQKIIEIHKTGITKILGRKGMIETFLDDIFWRNISLTLPEWIGINNSEKPLIRYTLNHLQEYLEISEDGTEFENVFPIENYIIPSIKSYFYTGDIIENESEKKRFVILTPACDLAPHGNGTPKAKDILLAEIQSLKEGVFAEKVTQSKKIPTADDASKISSAKSDLENLIKNNYSPKYYYIPDTLLVLGGLINFQKLRNVKFSELSAHNGNYKKTATIASQFIKDIIAKFSFYYSRQGSPDFDFAKLFVKHLE